MLSAITINYKVNTKVDASKKTKISVLITKIVRKYVNGVDNTFPVV